MKICAYRDCEVEFEPQRRNQKYHTQECCKAEMNSRAKDAWADRRERRAGRPRQCKRCHKKLSAYNDTTICNACSVKEKDSVNKRALDRVYGRELQ